MMAYGWRDFVLATSPKVASTSIAHGMAARGVAMIPGEKMRASTLPVVGIIREPVDRLLSCYQFFMAQPKGAPGPFLGKPDFRAFLAGVEETIHADTANHHWQPQCDQLRGVTHYVPFTRLDGFWREFMGEPSLPHENRAPRKHMELSRSILQRIQRLYAADAAQYAAAVARYDNTMETLRWAVAQRESRTPVPKPAAR